MSSLKVLEDKVQDLVIMFDSPKLFKLQFIFSRLSVKSQKDWNKDIEEIIVALYYIGKHITKDVKADLSAMGVKDSSFLIKQVGQSYDEGMTFKENEFLIKKAYQFFIQWFNCYNLYKMTYPIYIKSTTILQDILRKTRYTLNLFTERINCYKNRSHSAQSHKNKRSELTSFVSRQIQRKGLKSNSVLRRSNNQDFILGSNFTTKTNSKPRVPENIPLLHSHG